MLRRRLLMRQITSIEFPASLSDLGLWLDASDLSSLILSGSSVTEWRDKGRFSNHVSTSNGSEQPTLTSNALNSRPVVTFNGSNILRKSAPVGLTGLNDWNFFIVCKFTSSAAIGILASIWNNSGSQISWAIGKSNTDVFLYHCGDNGTFQDALNHSDTHDDEYILVEVRHTAGTALEQIEIDGVISGNNGLANGLFASTADLRIGSRFQGGADINLWNGDLAELIIYSRILSVDEQTSMRAYLFEKWGVS